MIATIGSIIFQIQHQQGKHNTFPGPEDGKQLSDLVLANFRMKLEVRCCPKSIRTRLDLDTLNEPEIESDVPDSDC